MMGVGDGQPLSLFKVTGRSRNQIDPRFRGQGAGWQLQQGRTQDRHGRLDPERVLANEKHGCPCVSRHNMPLAPKQVPCPFIVTAHDHEDTAGETHLVGPPQAVEHVNHPGAVEKPAFAARLKGIGKFDRPQQRGMKARLVRGQPGAVGHHPKLAKIRNGAGGEARRGGNGVPLVNKLLPITVRTLPEAKHPGIGVAVLKPAERILFIEYEVIFAGFPGRQYLQPEGCRPACQTDQQAWLVPFNLGIDNALLLRHPVQDGADDDPRLLGCHDHMAPLADGPFRNGGGGLRLTCGLHQHVKIRHALCRDVRHHDRR